MVNKLITLSKKNHPMELQFFVDTVNTVVTSAQGAESALQRKQMYIATINFSKEENSNVKMFHKQKTVER